MRPPTKNDWYYHSFDDHNDDAWRNYWMYSEDGDFDKDYGYGGFTLYFNPVTKVAGVSLCSLKDRFVKKIGRGVAEEIARGFVSPFTSSNSDWFVLCPTISTASTWVGLMLRCARYAAVDVLMQEYPHGPVSFYTPKSRQITQRLVGGV